MGLNKSKFQELKNFDNDGESKLGFALTCLISGAITMKEFKQWCIGVIEFEDNPHAVFFDLLDFDDSIPQMYSLFRDENVRYPYVEMSKRQDEAISAIGYKRGLTAFEDVKGQKRNHLNALSKEPEILELLKSEFSFISLSP